MKSKKIKLSENHKRSLTSALTIIEKMLFDLEISLTCQQKGCCYEVEKDMSDEIIQKNMEVINEVRKNLCLLATKYGTGKSRQSLRKVVNTIKTRIWEILMDMRPGKQKGFGEFPAELADEYSRDIDYLLSITEKISV